MKVILCQEFISYLHLFSTLSCLTEHKRDFCTARMQMEATKVTLTEQFELNII